MKIMTILKCLVNCHWSKIGKIMTGVMKYKANCQWSKIGKIMTGVMKYKAVKKDFRKCGKILMVKYENEIVDR